MLPRLYLVAGSLLLAGYALSEVDGWEFGRTVLVSPAPAVGAIISAGSGGGGRQSSYSHGSSTYRGSPVYTGPTGGK